LLSKGRRVVGMNSAAETLLREQSEFGVDRDGHLRAEVAADDDALRAAARQVVDPGKDPRSGPLAVTVNRPPRAPLRVLLTPLPQNHALPALDPDAQAVALVAVVDPETVQRAKAAALSALYGLTTAEARVAVVLATGVGRVKVAEQLHVSPETVKKHTTACFRKVGVTTQAGLAYVVASVPSSLP
jgi:DNA-binding CsgD family transcriptional regulator